MPFFRVNYIDFKLLQRNFQEKFKNTWQLLKNIVSLQPNFENRFKTKDMSRICQLTGKTAMGGNNVSHSNAKTPRQFKVNLKRKRFFVPETGEWVTLRVSTSAIKNINKKGIFACMKEAKANGVLA